MPLHRSRKPPQHDIEAISRAQLSELLHRRGWVASAISPDHGEDFLVQIFEDGNTTGHAFYVQVKGTSDSSKHALKSEGYSYAVDVVALRHWRRNDIPTVFILWDIERRMGFWLHLRPYIEQMLQQRPNWLDDDEGQRAIRIPHARELTASGLSELRAEIGRVFRGAALSKQNLEDEQGRQTGDIDHRLAASIPSPDERIAHQPEPVRIRIQQQARVAELEAAVAADPTNAEAWATLASVYYDLNEFDKALAASNRATGLPSRTPQMLWIRACILTEYAAAHGKQPKSMLLEALTLFTRLRPGAADASTADYNIGNTLMYLGKYREAIVRFDQALTENPKPPLASEIWKNRGTCYFHEGDHEEEFRSYRRALDLWPERWEAYSSWAVTDMRLGNFEHAKDMLLDAMKINPDLAAKDATHLYWLAFSCWKLGDTSEAYRRVNQALAIRPQYEQAWLLKARLLGRLWRSDEAYMPSAAKFFRARVADRPDDMFARRELYLLLSSMGQQATAQALAKSTLPPPDASAQALFHYAAILEDEGRVEDSIRHLEVAFEKNRDHNIVHKLAALKQRVGRYQEAIELYQLIERDEPEQVWPDIANCYYGIGNHLEALRYCARLAIRDPDNEAWWNNMSIAAVSLIAPSVALLHNVFFGLPSLPDMEGECWRQVKVQTLTDALRSAFGDEFAASVLS
jgi:tetratricopeptide (TPR) repeat protein